MRRLLGTILVILGCLIMVVEIPSIEGIVLPVTGSHGLHLTDFIGGVLVLAGVFALWTAPPR